jgi:putative endonuclease
LPWEVIYTEEFSTREEALQKEKYYKSAAGRKNVKKIIISKNLPR